MDDCLLASLDGLECTVNQLLPALGKYLDTHILRDHPPVN